MNKKIFANLLDETILCGISAILMLLTGLIFGAVGFKVLQPTVFLSAYLFIANVFYFPIMQKHTTLGERILKVEGAKTLEGEKI